MTTNDPAERFAFGRNWQHFVATSFSEERVAIAQKHLLDFLGVESLAQRRMIDIGCGSGIHSLAAMRAGVSELVSFDYDADSVATTEGMRALLDAPPNWTVSRGSILDREYMNSLGQFDLVYSWGVLHHTGDLWAAFQNAAALVAPGGSFYVALYATETAHPSPEFWLSIKKRYNVGGALTRRAIEGWYVARNIAGLVKRGKNPVTYILGYKRSRGMSYLTDVRDWVGGWPMEYSSVAQVAGAAKAAGLKLVKTSIGEANTEYLFTR